MAFFLKPQVKAVSKVLMKPFVRGIRRILREELAVISSGDTRQENSAAKPANGISPFSIDPSFFSELDDRQKRTLFANNVELVYLETHSKCNRKCWFCGNATIDRSSKNLFMEDKVFFKALSELKEIKYDGDLSFSVYNEPLADANIAITRILPARKILPGARLHFNTNGDYLDKDKLVELADAGLNRILVSIYVDAQIETPYNYESAEKALREKAKSFGFEPTMYTAKNDLTCVSMDRIGSLNVILHSQNHRIYSQNRGDSLPGDIPIPRIDKRKRSCASPYIQISVQYDGNALPCVHLRGDWEKHRGFIGGNVKDVSIFDIFAGEIFTDFRKKRTMDINSYPCNSCTTDAETSILNPPNEPALDRPKYRRGAG